MAAIPTILDRQTRRPWGRGWCKAIVREAAHSGRVETAQMGAFNLVSRAFPFLIGLVGKSPGKEAGLHLKQK